MHDYFKPVPMKRRTECERMKEGADLDRGLSGSMQIETQPDRHLNHRVDREDPYRDDEAGASTYD